MEHKLVPSILPHSWPQRWWPAIEGSVTSVRRRDAQVSAEAFARNWERTFGKKKTKRKKAAATPHVEPTANGDHRSYLLIVLCAKRKVTNRGSLPALELYDGPNYRIIRKFFREYGPVPGLTIKILSAECGLIDPTKVLPPYDVRMDPTRAAEIEPTVTQELRKLGPFDSVFVNLGGDYKKALGGVEAVFKDRVQWSQGRTGQRMAGMKRWLESIVTNDRKEE